MKKLRKSLALAELFHDSSKEKCIFLWIRCSKVYVRERRNPRVFNGEYITLTRRDDGSLRPNFKPMKTGSDFNIHEYALGVANELRIALEGLLEERDWKPFGMER